MTERTLICRPVPKRRTTDPDMMELVLVGIGTDPHLPDIIMAGLKTTKMRYSRKEGKKIPRTSTRGVKRIEPMSADTLYVMVVDRDAMYKTASRIHRIIERVLKGILDDGVLGLDRDALRPHANPTHIRKAAERARQAQGGI